MKHKILISYLFILLIIVACNKKSINSDIKNIDEVEKIEIFPANHPLNQDISKADISPNSEKILQNIGLDKGLFADFGSGEWNGAPIGIPYIVVGKNQKPIEINYTEYGDESDPGPFPIPLTAPVEGNGQGDAHVLCVDIDRGMLYELFSAKAKNNDWNAGSGAKFDLNKIEYRPAGWTSADAAGLPIFPCLVRYPEIKINKEIDHVIRFTLPRNKIYEGYVSPARHLVSGGKAPNLLPFGAKLRLKANFDISGFSKTNQIILKAMKKYGIILADVGSSMYISGAPNENWNNDDLKNLKKVKVSDFDVINFGNIQTK